MLRDTEQIGLVGPVAMRVPMRGVGRPLRTVVSVPLVVVGADGTGWVLCGGVVEVRNGGRYGTYAAVVCEVIGRRTLRRGGPSWCESEAFPTRARAYEQLFAFLALWSYHRWH